MVDLNCNFECDWLIELSDNNLTSEVVENRSFFEPKTIEGIVIFMIINIKGKGKIKRGVSRLWKKVKKCGER